jgi:hypothetical protein
MKSFQLDQCSNHAGFARNCNTSAQCKVLRLPTNLKDHDDDVVLQVLQAQQVTILTIDFTIVEDNPNDIVADNPGIIVVKVRPNTEELMREYTENFKRHFPDWAETNWSRVYLEIEETGVYLHKLVDGNISNGITIKFSENNFIDQVTAAITTFQST